MTSDLGAYDYERKFRNIKRLVAVLLAVLFLNFWGGLWFYLARSRAYLLDKARIDATNLARSLEENVFRVAKSIDQVLVGGREDYLANPAGFTGSQVSRIAGSLRDVAFQLAVADAKGDIVMSTLALSRAKVNIADREHFQIHRNAADDLLFISRPVLGKVSGRWSIQFTRRVSTSPGRFDGVMVLSVDPHYFSNYYSELEIGPQGSVAILGSDGFLRARSVFTPDILDKRIDEARLQSALSASAQQGFFAEQSALDGRKRIYHFRRVRDSDLIVVVGLAEEDVLRNYQREFMLILGLGALFTAILGYTGWFVLSRFANVVASDLDYLHSQEREIKRLAQQDDLTGLYNRNHFLESLAAELASCRACRRLLAVLFIDLDHFKDVNDQLGHAMGDELLKAVAECLRQSVRSSDCIARYGGDEFVILLGNLDEPGHVTAVAAKILNALKRDIAAMDLGVRVSVSIGISLYPDHGDNVESLLHNADQAMYAAKSSGGGRYLLYAG